MKIDTQEQIKIKVYQHLTNFILMVDKYRIDVLLMVYKCVLLNMK